MASSKAVYIFCDFCTASAEDEAEITDAEISGSELTCTVTAKKARNDAVIIAAFYGAGGRLTDCDTATLSFTEGEPKQLTFTVANGAESFKIFFVGESFVPLRRSFAGK